MDTSTWVVIGIVVLIGLWLMMTYNRLVAGRNQAKNAWSQIDVQLKRRHDLIPNLVNAVKGYMDFEQDTLTRVTEARANAVAAGSGVRPKASASRPAMRNRPPMLWTV